MSVDEFREAIAKDLEDLVSSVDNHTVFTELYYRRRASGLLDLEVRPGITWKHAIEQIQAGKWVELDDDQGLPVSHRLDELCERMDKASAELGKGESDKSTLLQRTVNHLSSILAEVGIREKAIKDARFRRVSPLGEKEG